MKSLSKESGSVSGILPMMVLRSSYIEPVFGHRPGYQRVCVSTDEADCPNEGVDTRRFFLVVLEGTIRPS